MINNHIYISYLLTFMTIVSRILPDPERHTLLMIILSPQLKRYLFYFYDGEPAKS